MRDGSAGERDHRRGLLLLAAAVNVFVADFRFFALLPNYNSNSVSLVEISDPSSPQVVAEAVDGADGYTQLQGARSADALVYTDGSIVAAVASYNDDGIQLIKLRDAPAAHVCASHGEPYSLTGCMDASHLPAP